MSDDLVKRLRNERDKARIAAANYAEFNHEWRRRAEQAEARADALAEKLEKLERWQAAAFIANGNLDLDIEANPEASAAIKDTPHD